MRELLDRFDGSTQDEKGGTSIPGEIDTVYRRLRKGDSHTYGHTRDTSIF